MTACTDGAEGGTRTPTVLLPPAPQAGASANSATSAFRGLKTATNAVSLFSCARRRPMPRVGRPTASSPAAARPEPGRASRRARPQARSPESSEACVVAAGGGCRTWSGRLGWKLRLRRAVDAADHRTGAARAPHGQQQCQRHEGHGQAGGDLGEHAWPRRGRRTPPGWRRRRRHWRCRRPCPAAAGSRSSAPGR